MVNLGPHLGVHGEPAVETVAWFGKEAHGKFALKHEDADSGGGSGG